MTDQDLNDLRRRVDALERTVRDLQRQVDRPAESGIGSPHGQPGWTTPENPWKPTWRPGW